MHELNSLTDLPHNTDARLLCEQKIFADGAIKQLTAVYTATFIVKHYCTAELLLLDVNL